MLYSVLLSVPAWVFCILDLFRFEGHAPFGRKRNFAGAELSWSSHLLQRQGIRDADWWVANFFRKIQLRKNYLGFSHASGLPGAGVSDDSAL